MSQEIRVPDIGDFKSVPVIEIHVKQGDRVEVDDPLISLESDKATMEVPSPIAGTVGALKIAVGDKVGEGDVILVLEEAGVPATPPKTSISQEAAPATGSPAGYGSPAGAYDAVHVKAGDTISADEPLITLESDKAAMEVPAPAAGIVVAVKVAAGDKVSEGDLILTLSTGAKVDGAVALGGGTAPVASGAPAPAPKPPAAGRGDVHGEVVVLGGGPGGYTAAFRAADLGTIDIDALRGWKDGVIKKLTGGLGGLAKQRKVTVVTGTGRFTAPNRIEVQGEGGAKSVSFDHAIIAAGSEPVTLPFIPHHDPRVIDSTGALALGDVPKRLLVIGGGIIGLEMATVYEALGSKVTIVELMDQIIPGADKDIVTPLMKRVSKRFEAIHLKAKVTKVEAAPAGLVVSFEGGSAPATDTYDKILVAVGRRPNGRGIGAENAGVAVDERGFVTVDKQMRTNVPHIFAIGDVVGQPMLAHKAVHEGKVAAENASGHPAFFDAKVIPSVAYTDPEVAWVGMTENEAKAKGVKYGKGVFPWAASGRSLSLGRDEGITKVLFEEGSERIIGCGIVGPSAGDLIAEAALAIEMGADAADIGATIHPHPTLSETVGMAAEAFEGTITDLYMPKKK